MLRYLRLTVAVACLSATACFVILWMRSDAVKDVIWVGGDSSRISRISTPQGRLVLSTRRSPYEGKWRGIAQLLLIDVIGTVQAAALQTIGSE